MADPATSALSADYGGVRRGANTPRHWPEAIAQRRVAPLRPNAAVQIISGWPPPVLQACG
jgi:hypothetical protein